MISLFWRWLFPAPRDPDGGVELVAALSSLREGEGLPGVRHDPGLCDGADAVALRVAAGLQVPSDFLARALGAGVRGGWAVALTARTDAPARDVADAWHFLARTLPSPLFAGASRRGRVWVMVLAGPLEPEREKEFP